MNINDIKSIIKEFDVSSIQELTLENGETSLKLKKAEVFQPVVSTEGATEAKKEKQLIAVENDNTFNKAIDSSAMNDSSLDENTIEITSPMVGTFYASSSPEASPYVKVGDKVSQSDVLCIVEAMKLFNEIEAEVDGEIARVHVEDGQLVEYGQPLFTLKIK